MILRKSNYSTRNSYRNNSFQNTKKIKYYLQAFFGKVFYFILVITSLIFMRISLTNSAIDGVVRNSVIAVSKPIFVVAELPFNLLFDFTSAVKNLVLTNFQNKKLVKENAILRQLYIESFDMKAENENLKKLLNFKNSHSEKYNYVTSRIYVDSKNGMTNTILLHVGSDDGIGEGNLVVGINGGAIGRVINVDKKHSHVLLLSDINSRIPTRTAATKERIILSGTNRGDDLEITFFNSKFPEIVEGDYVYTSGDSKMIPDGFIVGKIKKVGDEFMVEMSENLSSIFDVMVLTPIN